MSSHAILAAARNRDIDLFGDLPCANDVHYFSRTAVSVQTAVSVRQHTFNDAGSDFDPDIGPSGKRIVFASTRHHVEPDLYLQAVDGAAVTQITADPAPDLQPAFSPDGMKIAFASRRSGNWDIWITHLNGGPPVQVTAGPADELHPSWSPDGRKLVYCSLPAEGRQWELWVAELCGSTAKRFVGYGLFPEWSPVGDTIVYQRARERGSRWFSIWTISFVADEPGYPTEIGFSTSQAMIQPTWSPDGKYIAYAATAIAPPADLAPGAPPAEGVFDIWMMDVEGRNKARLTDGHTTNHGPVFSGDNRLFFSSNRSGSDNIWSLLPGTYAPADHTDARPSNCEARTSALTNAPSPTGL